MIIYLIYGEAALIDRWATSRFDSRLPWHHTSSRSHIRSLLRPRRCRDGDGPEPPKGYLLQIHNVGKDVHSHLALNSKGKVPKIRFQPLLCLTDF